MKEYCIPFRFRDKCGHLKVIFGPNPGAEKSGFGCLPGLPFSAEECRGYPMVNAEPVLPEQYGYERYCGFIQIVRKIDRSEDDFCAEEWSLDTPENILSHGLPYFAFGYPAILFDAPCRNLKTDTVQLDWMAFTFLISMPMRGETDPEMLAGFSWGYSENAEGVIGLKEPEFLTHGDWEICLSHVSLFPEKA